MIDIAEKTGGRKYVGIEEIEIGEAGVIYFQSGYCDFFSPGVTVGRRPSCCILFYLVEFVGLLFEPK